MEVSSSRELDALMAEHVLGYTVQWYGFVNRTEPFVMELGRELCPKYSTRLSDAMKVVDALWRRHGVATTIRFGLRAAVTLTPPQGADMEVSEKLEDLPHAICVAALELFGEN